MKRLFIFWLLACFVAVVPAQQTKKSSQQKRTTTTKTATTKKSTKGKTTTKTQKSQSVSVNSLKNEQQQVRKQIQEQQRKLQANERDVKKRLQNLLVLNNEIADKRKVIDTIRHDINRLDDNIEMLQNQLKMLQHELDERKLRYTNSMRYMHRNRNIQSKMMFVFGAKNFSQMYRRLRFVREYASYQQTQGEAVISMQQQVHIVLNRVLLNAAFGRKSCSFPN